MERGRRECFKGPEEYGKEQDRNVKGAREHEKSV